MADDRPPEPDARPRQRLTRTALDALVRLLFAIVERERQSPAPSPPAESAPPQPKKGTRRVEKGAGRTVVVRPVHD
jgi:hypothetical protein